MTHPQLSRLKAMGIEVWSPRTKAEVPEAVVLGDQEFPVDSEEAATGDWQGLESQVAKCTACALHSTRTQTVFGVGHKNPTWLVVGEAPGADEDAKGEPFVGRAGKLLDAMLQAAGFERPQVYITNIVKCRPPNNRNPKPEEAEACGSFLAKQIAWLQPRLILAVGRVAANNLLDNDLALGRMRGAIHRYGSKNVPVIVTYHPAYLLRKPSEKRKVWEDLCAALTATEELVL